MEIIAQTKSVRISPRKVRLVADTIRNMPVDKAMQMLIHIEKRGSSVLQNTLKSAIANAVNNAKLKQENLIIGELLVNQGSFLKRYHASTRGRIHPYKKKSSHVKIVLKEKGGSQ